MVSGISLNLVEICCSVFYAKITAITDSVEVPVYGWILCTFGISVWHSFSKISLNAADRHFVNYFPLYVSKPMHHHNTVALTKLRKKNTFLVVIKWYTRAHVHMHSKIKRNQDHLHMERFSRKTFTWRWMLALSVQKQYTTQPGQPQPTSYAQSSD
jgi:hypothetical protein